METGNREVLLRKNRGLEGANISEFEFLQFLQRYDASLAPGREDVGMETGATIHTQNGLWVNLKLREQVK